MTIDEKEQALKRMFDKADFIDERDKISIIAYIKGTADTRERMKTEMKYVQHETKEQQ